MKKMWLVLAGLALLGLCDVASAQTKPATSGQPSFYEPEPNPRGPGEYHPNEPHDGRPAIGREKQVETTPRDMVR